ncbi:hypothetical protein DIS24_g2185 [Lasiodiplodia hormozganensis]|uniref:AA1-like domain-containing protein n=1 Tax=Lasiodiplodia hormozganensis TaxID=869390 RepID=A0AA39Z228_9PEZI|nr:hypothetical protein DIS24_g2185 [Lasiodiplodia hormozganensis]
MHSALFAIFGFATAAYTASIPRAALKSFEVTGFNFTQAAGSDAANVYFYVNEPNTGGLTICGDDAVRPNELRFCNGVPQFVFGDDFKTLSVSWLWGADGPDHHTSASGTANVTLNCVDDPSQQGQQQCTADDFKIEPTIVAP